MSSRDLQSIDLNRPPPTQMSDFTIDSVYGRVLRKKTPHQLKKICDQINQNSLSEQQITSIVAKAMRDKRVSKNIDFQVIDTIKGKPYCLKLGQSDPHTDNFPGFINTFYTNMYKEPSHKKPGYVVRSLNPVQSNYMSRRRTVDEKASTIGNQNNNRSFSRFSMSTDKENQTLITSGKYRPSGPRPSTSNSEVKEIGIQKSKPRQKLQEQFNNIISGCNMLLGVGGSRPLRSRAPSNNQNMYRY